MKMLCTSDLHGELDGIQLDGYDVCAIAGDFAKLSGLSKWHVNDLKKWVQKKFIPWIQAHPNVQFAIVPGNHDLFIDSKWQSTWADLDFSVSWPDNAHVMMNSGCEICGIKFWGSPNVPIISYRWAFESDEAQQRDAFSKIPEGIDVLIAHAPPHMRDLLIDVSLAYGPDSRAFGSNALTAAILEKKPKVLLCGHIHTGDHSPLKIGDTVCYNVSRLDEAYEIKYEPLVLELEA